MQTLSSNEVEPPVEFHRDCRLIGVVGELQNEAIDCIECFGEAKGKWTADAGIKLRLWREGLGPGTLEIWTGNWRNPVLSEIITPKVGKNVID